MGNGRILELIIKETVMGLVQNLTFLPEDTYRQLELKKATFGEFSEILKNASTAQMNLLSLFASVFLLF